MHLGSFTITVEITDILLNSCEVLITGVESDGQLTVLDAQQCSWPIYARDWRAMMDTTRRWLVESVGTS